MDIDETQEPAVLQLLYAQRGDYVGAERTQRWVIWVGLPME